jgi:hypothetical protein
VSRRSLSLARSRDSHVANTGGRTRVGDMPALLGALERLDAVAHPRLLCSRHDSYPLMTIARLISSKSECGISNSPKRNT